MILTAPVARLTHALIGPLLAAEAWPERASAASQRRSVAGGNRVIGCPLSNCRSRSDRCAWQSLRVSFQSDGAFLRAASNVRKSHFYCQQRPPRGLKAALGLAHGFRPAKTRTASVVSRERGSRQTGSRSRMSVQILPPQRRKAPETGLPFFSRLSWTRRCSTPRMCLRSCRDSFEQRRDRPRKEPS